MASPRRALIAGNWKMNGLKADGIALARDLARRLSAADETGVDMVVCPPFTLVHPVAEAIAGSPLHLGAQDCHVAASGAHTGDVAAPMLADLGCRYVIVGHSERRTDHGEGDALVRDKAKAALAAGMAAIVCVGETEGERDAGQAEAVVRRQLAGSLPDGATPGTLVIAYEPMWAIGTGRTPTPADVQAMHAFVRRELAGRLGDGAAGAVRVLYGGSVNRDNAARLMTLPDVDGGLVGGASLKAEDFWAIARSRAGA